MSAPYRHRDDVFAALRDTPSGGQSHPLAHDSAQQRFDLHRLDPPLAVPDSDSSPAPTSALAGHPSPPEDHLEVVPLPSRMSVPYRHRDDVFAALRDTPSGGQSHPLAHDSAQQRFDLHRLDPPLAVPDSDSSPAPTSALAGHPSPPEDHLCDCQLFPSLVDARGQLPPGTISAGQRALHLALAKRGDDAFGARVQHRLLPTNVVLAAL
mmetsp:Transcript_170634/g.547334  ORF Transcript_170634/g.547334 Transcript_170634/m.547334 type:complete len:209 (+) Transcript_170634:2517-3143(+)